MNPMIVLSALFATAMAAPHQLVATAPGLVAAGPAALGYAAAPVAYAAAAAPIAPVVAPVAPAPKVTVTQAAGSTSVHKPDPIVTKQLHYGKTTYVANIHEQIHKPVIPSLPIAVPTALKGSVQVNPAIVKTKIQTHVVNEPVPVRKEIPVHYDKPVYVEQVRPVDVPYHVPKPYHVPVPTPVQGEPIVQHVQGPAIVRHTHSSIAAQPVGLVHAAPAIAYPTATAVQH